MPLPPSMEMELMNLGLIRSDLEELSSIARQTGFHETRAEIKAWHDTLILDGKVMF